MYSTSGARLSRSTTLGILFFAILAAVVLVFSQTLAFVWDEGFHLIAAMLIARGKTPYIDFCFPQTPLNAYANAALFRWFAPGWHLPHLLAAFFVIGTFLLTAEFVWAYMPIREWRYASALAAAVFVALNATVLQFGTIAQAYGSGMFFATAAFRAAIGAVARRSLILVFVAGCSAGVAACCTLLTAPAAVVLLAWIVWNYGTNEVGHGRVAASVVFILAAALPFVPIAWLYVRAPRQVLFNLLEYQALLRRVNWPGATLHDFSVWTGWLTSVQALLLGLLALIGLWNIFRSRLGESRLEPVARARFLLAGWLGVAIALFVGVAHPTFERYFIFVIPFLSILAVPGLYSIAARLGRAAHPAWPIAFTLTLTTLAGARTLFDNRDASNWQDYEKVARKVAEVTPPGARIFAEEVVYFSLGITPPFGMEFSYSHNLELPPGEEKLLHVVSKAEIKTQIHAGQFATVQTCKDDLIDYYGLTDLFPHSAEIGDCNVFWGKIKPQP